MVMLDKINFHSQLNLFTVQTESTKNCPHSLHLQSGLVRELRDKMRVGDGRASVGDGDPPVRGRRPREELVIV